MNELPPDKVDDLYAAFAAGKSSREIVRSVGVAKNTVTGHRRLWLAAGNAVPLCACGRTSDHRGWCAVRFARSPTRQQAMRDMQARRMSA